MKTPQKIYASFCVMKSIVLKNQPPSFWGFYVSAADFKRRSPDSFHFFQQFLHLELPTQVSHRAANGFGFVLGFFWLTKIFPFAQ